MIGGFGHAEVFSFHATKFLNCLEGGAVVTNDSELARKIGLMKNFGFAGYDNVVSIGTNGKMNEVSAAMGLTGLEALDDFIATNRAHYEQYALECLLSGGTAWQIRLPVHLLWREHRAQLTPLCPGAVDRPAAFWIEKTA